MRTRRACFAVTGTIGLLFGVAWSAPAQTVLVDGVHAHTYDRRPLTPDEHDYHALGGSATLIAELRARGARVDVMREGRLSAERLSGVEILYVDLVSDDLPAFMTGEIAAIVDFVRAGGGLFLVTDHSNAYHHVNKLEPLLELLDLRAHRESALDPMRSLGDGPGWIAVEEFSAHPIVYGIGTIALQTGGPTDDRWGVAWTSAQAWGDRWTTAPYGENAGDRNDRGNYGDFVRADDERGGPLAVVSARDFGRGRIVVVGDQNLLGNVWIRYADNLAFALSAIAWVGGHERYAAADGFPLGEGPRVLLFEETVDPCFGDDGRDGFHRAFVALARRARVLARSTIPADADVVVVPPRVAPLDPTQVEMLAAHLRGGGRLSWMTRGTGIAPEHAADLDALREVAPDRVRTVVHAERFDNDRLAAPTQVPDEAQRAAATAWIESVMGTGAR